LNCRFAPCGCGEGVDVNAKDKDGHTPLYSALAGEEGNDTTVTLLLDRGSDIDKNGVCLDWVCIDKSCSAIIRTEKMAPVLRL
jgi:hypothetical protein